MSKDTEWMYSGSSKPDPESYLLGRRIDDAIDPTQETSDSADWISGKVPEDGDIGARAEMWKTRDAFAKAREDPMFIIEKQKRSAHVDFKNNPLKMQKIRDLLASELKKDLKKKKKRRKSMEEESSKSSLSSDSRRKHRKSRSLSPEQSSSRGTQRHRSRSPVQPRRRRSRDRSRDRQRSRSRDKQRSRSREKVRKRRSRSRSRDRETKKSPAAPKPAPYKAGKPKPAVARGGSGISKKMTAEELERKRAEMMNNASSRDSERREKYTSRKDTEVADTTANKEGKAEFLHKFKVESYSSSSTSVEERIKSGIFSKQRTKADLNTFLKK